MASCNLGTSHLKLTKLEFGRVNVNALHQRSGSRTSMGRKQLQYAGLAISHDKKKAYTVCRGSPSETESSNRVECPKDSKSSSLVSQLIPNSSEVESLVAQVCDATSIAEFELKLGGFRLYVMRELKEKSTPLPPPPQSPAPASVSTTSSDAVSTSVKKAFDSNGSASTSLAITKREPSALGIQSLLDRAADEGLMILHSPRVGFFRRSRTIKGKRAPPACKEKQIVKEGQVVCYIEQLGGELPIESDVGGEVIKILREDGEPVGYGDALIAVLPSFPGIKKLQ